MGLPNPQEPEPRRHHYVPRCWLAGFTENGEKNGRLWVTDFCRQKQWPSTPDNAGHIRDFYRLTDLAPDPVIVEKFFSVLEDQTAPLLRNIDRERRRPNDDEWDALLTFMAYQWVRVPQFRPLALQVLDRITRERLAQELQSPETWLAALKKAEMDADAPGAEYEGMKRFFESGEWNITAETDWYMQRAFKDAGGILECLRERFWGISFTDTGRLIASDSPVVLDGEKGQMVGFKNAEVVLYPVSRHALLTGALKRTKKPVENFKYFASLNTMMMLGADTQVYSHVPDFSWLDENRKHQSNWRLFSKDRF
ncbi:MAG TPA: DUF4238 domain-containing protein [Bryobacteraceae bacterium]|nr:DUF4238 domain-containing protein [Bryobacteraceae bacterium]